MTYLQVYMKCIFADISILTNKNKVFDKKSIKIHEFILMQTLHLCTIIFISKNHILAIYTNWYRNFIKTWYTNIAYRKFILFSIQHSKLFFVTKLNIYEYKIERFSWDANKGLSNLKDKASMLMRHVSTIINNHTAHWCLAFEK